MSDLIDRSVAVGAPELGHVHAFSVTTGTLNVRVPADLYGAFVRFLARGSDVQIALTWGVEPPSLTFDATSAVSGTGTITSSAVRGATVQAGVPEQFIVPDRPRGAPHDYVLWLSMASAAPAKVEFYSTEGWRQVR